MRRIVTINKKIEFDSELSEVQKSITRIVMNGLNTDVETKVYPTTHDICGYKVFKTIFHKKFNVVGIVDGKKIDSVLREYMIPILVADDKKYVLSYSQIKGVIARAAFKRIRKDTKIKCSPIKLDLIDTYTIIRKNISNVEVYSGWFSKLGTKLKNALLQGDGVDNAEDWEHYKKVKGAELKNIQLRFIDDMYPVGSIVISISSRGFIFTNGHITDTQFIELVDQIIELLDAHRIIKDAEEEEEEVYNVSLEDIITE